MSDGPDITEAGGLVLVTVPASVFHWMERSLRDMEREIATLKATVLRQQAAMAAQALITRSTIDRSLIQPFADPNGKIPTIKTVREMSGLGLKEAKDLVDEWEAKGLVSFPTYPYNP